MSPELQGTGGAAHCNGLARIGRFYHCEDQPGGVSSMVSDRSNGVYRSVFTALVGLILIGTDEPPKQAAQGQQGKAAQPQPKRSPSVAANTAKPVEAIKSAEYERPCREGGENRNSDLCAQWKAADAAKNAADWAMRSFWIGILGFLGLLASLYYTRKAVKVADDATKDADRALEIANRNADAAVRLAEISERTAKIQLRAYVSVDKAEIAENDWSPDGHYVIVLQVSNNGPTPAKIYNITVTGHWNTDKEPVKIVDCDIPLSFQCHPGPPTRTPIPFSVEFGDIEGIGVISLWGVIRYQDVFGKRRISQISFGSLKGDIGDIDFDFGLVRTNEVDLAKAVAKAKPAE
jgi:hypothetical protein